MVGQYELDDVLAKALDVFGIRVNVLPFRNWRMARREGLGRTVLLERDIYAANAARSEWFKIRSITQCRNHIRTERPTGEGDHRLARFDFVGLVIEVSYLRLVNPPG